MSRQSFVGIVLVATLGGTACSGKYRRPVTPERVDSSAERLARGSYLVNQEAACGACHTPREGGDILSGERTDMYLAGGAYVEEREMGAALVVPNITPDPTTGIGAWSDDELMRAIRDGVSRDGRLLIPMMPFSSYQYMSEEDVRAIVAYLRSVPPVNNPVDRAKNKLGFVMSFMLNRGVAHHLPAKDVKAPPPPSAGGDKVRYGEYVARLGHCWECHSDKSGRGPDEDWMFGGGNPMSVNGVGRVFVRNLTPDVETGLGRYSAAQLTESMKTGKRLDGRPMAPPMSLFMPHFSGLTDEDMDALVTYLRAQKPIKNKVPERELAPATKKALGTND